MKRQLLFFLFCLCAANGMAQNWDAVRESGDYYWGQGTAATTEEARQEALAALTSMIATNVQSDFTLLSDQQATSGSVDYKERVLRCLRTYSQATLTNVHQKTTGREPNITVQCWMARTELHRIYANRQRKALSMVNMANEALGQNKVDVALQHYYWAYALLRSLQHPSEVADAQGHVLVDWLPVRISDVLSGLRITAEGRDGDRVNLAVSYKGEPVSGLSFFYNDGRIDCDGQARDGHATLELIPGAEPTAYHLDVDYACSSLARGDGEMESVLAVVPLRPFPNAHFDIATTTAAAPAEAAQGAPREAVAATPPAVPEPPRPSDSLSVGNVERYAAAVGSVVQAITSGKYDAAGDCFTLEGYAMYDALLRYGRARVVGQPRLRYYKGLDGRVVVRGLTMSFAVSQKRKQTFVEDVALTFNADGLIENVAFGVGRQTEGDILEREGTAWDEASKEQVLEFLESYKTAYCLKRLDYLRQVFADDAIIIVGHVAWRPKRQTTLENGPSLSDKGEKVVTTNRFTKDEYLRRLGECFDKNEFINIRFTTSDLQSLPIFSDDSYGNRKVWGIQLGQDYTSATYADMGYLYLQVDMTNPHEPILQIRTWQPNEVDPDKIYHAGWFYK